MRKEDFPAMGIGDVIRVHSMKTDEYKGFMNGKVFDPRGITMVSGTVGDPIIPVSTSPKMTFTEYDKAR